MQQQQEQQGQIDQILPLIHGSAELSTFAHQWDSLHPDTPSSNHQGEVPPEEEAEADSQEEGTQEEVVVDSQVEEIPGGTLPNTETLREDLRETDWSKMLPSSTTEIRRGQKNLWLPGNYTKGLTEGRPKWTTCTIDPCFFSHISRDPQPQNGSIPLVTGLNKQFKSPMSTIDDYGITPKKHSNENLEIRYQKSKPSQN